MTILLVSISQLVLSLVVLYMARQNYRRTVAYWDGHADHDPFPAAQEPT